MFKNSRVDSCSRVICDQGVRKAIPFYMKTEGNESVKKGYKDIRTTNASSYRWRSFTNALDSSKPLIKVMIHKILSSQLIANAIDFQ